MDRVGRPTSPIDDFHTKPSLFVESDLNLIVVVRVQGIATLLPEHLVSGVAWMLDEYLCLIGGHVREYGLSTRPFHK